MTKYLSQLLEAKEPHFRQTVQKLESASGYSCNDIRLSENIVTETRKKIRDLGLDPEDTTGEELYYALQEKLRTDDANLVKRLRQISARNVSAAGELSEGIAFAVSQITEGSKVFVIKASVIKRFLEKNAPKKSMKVLGYRSISSMIKHESLGSIVTVALSLEPNIWIKNYEGYLKKISPRDFEERPINVYAPMAKKWQKICAKLMSETKQSVLVNKELGAMLVLPLPSKKPLEGLATVTLAMAAKGINSIYATSSYLRLSQVAGDFGQRIERATSKEPDLGFVDMLNAPLSWETVQRFFHHMSDKLEGSLEEHIGAEEIIGWQPIESLIYKISPEMSFWRGCGHLGMLDEIKPVFFNVLDNGLSLVNHRKYKEHYSHHAQSAIWQELMLRYIKPDMLHEIVNRELAPKLETELVNV